jgi:hypothetical protein
MTKILKILIVFTLLATSCAYAADAVPSMDKTPAASEGALTLDQIPAIVNKVNPAPTPAAPEPAQPPASS